MIERRALQIAVAIAGLVPVTAGAYGAWRPEFLGLYGAPSALTHAAYLNGLLLGIGVGFWSTVPQIERHRERFTLLAFIVVLGGLGSMSGTLVAALTLGIAENLTATFYGPSWSPAVAFGILLLTLAVRPSGLFGRA